MRTLVSIAAVGIILLIVHVAAGVVTPFLLGAALAITFQPVAAALDRRGFPPVVAAAVTTCVVLAVIALAGLLIYVAGSGLAASLPRYGDRLSELRDSLSGWLGDHGFAGASSSVQSFDVSALISDLVQSMALQLGGYLQALFFVLIVTAFIQLEAAITHRKLRRALGGARRTRWLEGALHDVQRYLIVKVGISLFNGVVLGLWCWAWGVDSPVLWGIVAFALNFIPFVGSILAAIPPILLSLVEGGPGPALGVAAGYVVVNLVVDNIAEPRILGHALGLSPLVLLLAMLIWGLVLGPVGAILSVPLTMTVKLLLERGDEDLRKLAMMMGNGNDARAGTTTSTATVVAPAT